MNGPSLEYDFLEGSINALNNNPLISLNESDSPIISDFHSINYIFDQDNIKEMSIPTSLDKIKIEFQNLEESSTNLKTLLLPKFFSYDEIMNLVSTICTNNKIRNKLKKGRSIEESFGYDYMSRLLKKRKREDNNINLFNEEEKKNENKRGRKAENCPETKHDKMSADNIIKKIKTKLFEYIVKFFNLLLKKMKLINELAKIDYKYIDNLKCENEFRNFKSTLKDILSLDISPKYKNKKKEYNKKVIEAIIENEIILNEKNDFNYDTLIFVLNMTFRGWLDVFTGKNNFENIANDYAGNQAKINFDLIKESFVGIDNLLGDLVNKYDDQYFAFFVFYLYNYERWFCIKSPRKTKKNKEENK